ncbi:MAG: tRNA pseudouridine(38-40) synthase TruA [Lachnospiraceae bacterium]|nr:tRNA pseudouridine(38-40) synthase TruA [Lachnospiraceae bacterium]
MRNFKMILQYEGTRYQGWQKQASTDNTIQGKLETLLFKMTGKKTEVQGSGRTDAGVHALGQVANFHSDTKMSPSEIMEYMNFYLPDDIAVISLMEAPERFHSRLNAKGKTYCYRVLNTAVPHIFDRRYVHMAEAELDTDRMRKAAEYLLGTHDFKAFTSNKRSKKSTVRTMEDIRIERAVSASMGMQGAEDEIRFFYSGNGFLYHMARIITGTLLEVGTHERKPEEVAEILRSGLRENAGELVPAKGLTLMEVRY